MSGARGAARLAWVALLAALAGWYASLNSAGAVLALLFLLPPLPGLWRGSLRAPRWAMLCLLPALLLALTEVVASPAARSWAVLVLALVLVALAALLAMLRSASRAG